MVQGHPCTKFGEGECETTRTLLPGWSPSRRSTTWAEDGEPPQALPGVSGPRNWSVCLLFEAWRC